MARKRIKQYLMLLTVIGVVAVAASGSGTFASFSASVTNPGNTFASGTLFLHDTHGVTTCTSESATTGPNFNVNPGDGTNGDVCAVLFSNVDLGGGPVTANLDLNNAGSINASDVKFKVNNCTVGTNSANTGSAVTFGAAPTCGDLWLTVQQTQSDHSTNVFCAFGPGVLGTNCAAPANTATLATAAATQTLQMDNGSGSATTATLGAGSTKYYVLKINPGGVASTNQLQNRSISFDVQWTIDQ
jgi:predicted ribosomally synthesized peptide with SipW-like signal peptide